MQPGSKGKSSILVLSDKSEVKTELSQLITKLEFLYFEASDLNSAIEKIMSSDIETVLIDSRFLNQLESQSFFQAQARKPNVNWILFKGEKSNLQQSTRFKFCKLNFIDDTSSGPEFVLQKVLKRETQLKQELEKLGYNSKQVQILEYMAKGECNKKIASVVNLSEQGVKYHVGIMLKKFSVKNRRDLQKKLQELAEAQRLSFLE